MQLKIRTAKLNKEEVSHKVLHWLNGEEVSLQKYEIIRYECVHYGKTRPYKHVVENSRPNTFSHAVRVRVS